jgi:hypothetical protein
MTCEEESFPLGPFSLSTVDVLDRIATAVVVAVVVPDLIALGVVVAVGALDLIAVVDIEPL